MSKITINTLAAMKAAGEKCVCITAYDATYAHLVNQAGVEIILVGDSLGMVMQGHDSTLPVTMDEMCYHTACVARGNINALVMADMPLMANPSLEKTLENAARLMRHGAHLVKLEGGTWLAESITALAQRGIPVCAHLGLTPQSVNKLGGYKVQGRDQEAAAELIQTAKTLEQAGADLLVLECVPSSLGKAVSDAVSIPVIGIGAGPDTDGQVLVLQDMLGITPGRTPRFVKNFMAGANDIQGAVSSYVNAVKTGEFPAPEHGFSA